MLHGSCARRQSARARDGTSRLDAQMRLTVGTFLALVLGSAVGAAAQGASTPSAGNAASAKNVTENMTVTGCLQRAEEASTPVTGTTGAERLPPGFVLINAKSGTTETQPADGTTYILDGGDLASKVGQRVEVKGTMTPSATGTSGTTPAAERHEAGSVTAETPGSVSPASAASTPRIRVTSVRAVGDCSSSR